MKHAVLLVENLPVPLDRRVWQEALALRDAGWSVTVIGPRGPGGMERLRENREGIHVLRYPQRAATGLRGYLVEYLPSLVFTVAYLIRLRMRGPIHVIHGCNPPDLFWVAALIGRLWGARYVFDQHDVNPELSLAKFGGRSTKGRVLHALTRWLEQRNYRAAALVIAPNDSYAHIARSRGRIPSERIMVVRNAPDISSYRRFAAGAAVRPHAVGYVGVMGSQDGLDLLIEAWARVVASSDLADAHLDLIGDGEAREMLTRCVTQLGLTSNVTFHGYLRPVDFVPILATCALCVSPDPPSAFNNVSTMVKVVDYLAIGRPIVAFDLHETIQVSGAAVHVARPPTAEALADAIVGLLKDPERIGALEREAASRADEVQLDWRVSADRLVQGYSRLVPPTAAESSIGGEASTEGRPTPR